MMWEHYTTAECIAAFRFLLGYNGPENRPLNGVMESLRKHFTSHSCVANVREAAEIDLLMDDYYRRQMEQ